MTYGTNETQFSSSEFYYAKLLLALTLRQSHGLDFAAAFLEEFGCEIQRATSRACTGMLNSAEGQQ